MQPDTDIEALALTLLGEARNQGKNGMIDVGCVVMNRLALGRWGHTVKDVCLAPWQFSCWNHNDPNREYLLNLSEDDPLYKTASALAQSIISKFISDRTNGSTFYFVKGSPMPKWAIGKTPCFVEGAHLFYRDIA